MARLNSKTKWDNIVEVIDQNRYLIPKSYKKGMRVDALVFSSPELIGDVAKDLSFEQAANVATLPGVVARTLSMPDMHQGYGFPIGGVAAMDPTDGVVSPGGVGFDINCGVRLMSSPFTLNEIESKLEDLMTALFNAVPTGAGKDGRIDLTKQQLDAVLKTGSNWAISEGFGEKRDIDHTEDGGCLDYAIAVEVSDRSRKRGAGQLGTLGSGNHFLEVDVVDQIFDREAAETFGLFDRQICFMVHCGSRGLGHQVCTDFVSTMKPVMNRFSIEVPDRELACCPIDSREGKSYLGAMAASANFAFANRQCITHWIRQVVRQMFGRDTDIPLVYDVAHNMAKFENHIVDGRSMRVLVHRKGATRAFPAGRPELAEIFQKTGQPVIIPGDMGTASYVLVGTEQALRESFGSVCHGAGRLMSRTQARQGRQSKDVIAALKARGVIAKASTREGLTEEVPEAYKPIDAVIKAVKDAGLARPVARLRPVGVVKG
ncbi:MAG: RtcB family protein [Candidatus Obscuribacterales bacterium]|nr:RtcB family protein [Candidatus Obscuribacterales bacterium]